MENDFMTQELEEMRTQINILKEKLEKQTIVNEEHIRRSIQSKIKSINKTVSGTVILGIFALIYATLFFYHNLSLIFTIATAIMLATCLVLTIVQKVALGKIDFSKGNVVDTAQVLTKIKVHYRDWYKISVPMLTVWFVWLIVEYIHVNGISSMTIGFICGSLVGGLLGGIFGKRINDNIVRQSENILSQIDELKKMD